eukprot:7923223-Pyramimonas_sp.AAC.1
MVSAFLDIPTRIHALCHVQGYQRVQVVDATAAVQVPVYVSTPMANLPLCRRDLVTRTAGQRQRL